MRVNTCIFYLSFFLLCGLKTSAFAQAITISEELPLRYDYAYTILGWVDKDLLLFRDRGHQFFIQAFDEELHLKWEREIYLGERKADIIGVVAHENRFHILYGMRDKGDYTLYHRSYDHDISLIDTAVLGVIPNVFISPSIQMKESEDESKVMLYQVDNSGLRLFSYDLMAHKVLWTNEIKLSGTNLQRDYTSMVISNAGDFFLPLEADKFLQRAQNLELFYSVPGTGDIMQETINLGDVQLYDFYPVYDNTNHNLVITGLYSDRNTSRALGFYFVRYQPLLPYTVHLLPFDESLLAEVHGREVSTSRGLSDFNVQQVALTRDGGAVLIAEMNKEFSRRSSLPVRRDNGAFARGGWVDYYYEDLILFAVHPDGTEHWKEVLRKRQYSQDDDAIYSSFFLLKTPSRLRFLFNDEIKQENTVGGYEVTGNGNVERKTVFNTDYQRLKLRFKDGVQVSNTECIVPSERNNRLNLVRIQYHE
jgi:hypothetical protein